MEAPDPVATASSSSTAVDPPTDEMANVECQAVNSSSVCPASAVWPGLTDIVVTSDAVLPLTEQPALDPSSVPAVVVELCDSLPTDPFAAPAETVMLTPECPSSSSADGLTNDVLSEGLAVNTLAGPASSVVLSSECVDCPNVNPSTDATDTNSTSAATFQDVLGFRLCPTRPKSSRKRNVAHATLLTSSPYKAWLQMQKNDKCETKNKKRKNASSSNLKTHSKKARKNDVSVKKNKGNENPSAVNKRETKSKKTKTNKKADAKNEGQALVPPNNNECPACHFTYGDASDPRIHDDWLECSKCMYSYHERCAEEVGVLDDAEFLCGNCI